MLGAGLRVVAELQVNRVTCRPRVLGPGAKNAAVVEEAEEVAVDAEAATKAPHHHASKPTQFSLSTSARIARSCRWSLMELLATRGSGWTGRTGGRRDRT